VAIQTLFASFTAPYTIKTLSVIASAAWQSSSNLPYFVIARSVSDVAIQTLFAAFNAPYNYLPSSPTLTDTFRA
jgi:hypothetical protein